MNFKEKTLSYETILDDFGNINWSKRKFVLGDLIAKGGGSKIFEVIPFDVLPSQKNQRLVVKFYNLEEDDKDDFVKQRLIEEKYVLDRLRNGKAFQFIDYHEVIKKENIINPKNIGTLSVGLVFPFMEEVVNNEYVIENHDVCKKNIKKIAFSLIKAVNSFHKAGVYHLDIKPSNMFITKLGEVVLTDFGNSSDLKNVMENSKGFLTTQHYRPYERFNLSMINSKIDVFSIGATLFFIYTGGGYLFPDTFPDDSSTIDDGIDSDYCTSDSDSESDSDMHSVYHEEKSPTFLENIKECRTDTWIRKRLKTFISDLKLRKFIFNLVRFDPDFRPELDEVLRYNFFGNLRVSIPKKKKRVEKKKVSRKRKRVVSNSPRKRRKTEKEFFSFFSLPVL